MKYLFLFISLISFYFANGQSFEKTLDTAPQKYLSYATASIAIEENTIIAINEDSTAFGNAKLVMLDKFGNISKTYLFNRGYQYYIKHIAQINDSTILLILYNKANSTLLVSKMDLNFNVIWFKSTGIDFIEISNIKKIDNNNIAVCGYFNNINKNTSIIIDSTGNVLNFNSTFKMFNGIDEAHDVSVSNDTIYYILQTHAWIDFNSLIIVSRLKNSTTNLNFFEINQSSNIFGDLIEIDKEKVILYGQNHSGGGAIRKFKYTFNKNLTLLHKDSLVDADGVGDSYNLFSKYKNDIYYFDYYSNKMVVIDSIYNVKTTFNLIGSSNNIYELRTDNNAVILTGFKRNKSPILNISYVHRFNPNVPLGLEDNSNVNFNIYPNPFTNHFSIPFTKEQAFVNLNIYNTLGQKKYSIRKENTSTISINNLDLQRGIYLIEINTPEGRLVRQFVKE